MRSMSSRYDKIYCSQPRSTPLSRNMTYRFRIGNFHYDNAFYNISMVAFYSNVNGVIQEINPNNYPNTDISTYMTVLSYTLIGVDSALLTSPIHKIQRVSLGVAERVEFVIKFDEANFIPPQVNNVYLVAFDSNANKYQIKRSFQLYQGYAQNRWPAPLQTSNLGNIKFYDLSKVSLSSIALSRMRPLISRPFDQRFVINGHYMFDMGASENPQIGTIEDWYIINTITEPHPIHMHLQQFQVVRTYSLKLSP